MLDEYKLRFVIGYGLVISGAIFLNWFAIVGGSIIVLVHLINQMATLLQPRIVEYVENPEVAAQIQGLKDKVEQLDMKIAMKR